MALLSILGLYNHNTDVFNDMVIPTADDITNDADKVSDPFIPDKTELIKYICMQCAELELVYADPDIMKAMLKTWSEVRNPTWCALYNTMLYEYNPIWNKDGLSVETRNLRATNYRTANLSETDNYTVTSMATTHTGDVTHNVTGYDTNSFSPESQDVPNTTDSTSGSTSNTKGTSGTDKHDMSDSGTVSKRETGNIGVTTTQKMIEEQRAIVQFNLYQTICDEFKEQFCVMIY